MKRIIVAGIYIFLAVNLFPQYVRGFSGAWYNPNGIIYIVNPLDNGKCEIDEVLIDNSFKVKKRPEIGIVHALDDSSINTRDSETVIFTDRIIKLSNLIYLPTSGAMPIDFFGNIYPRRNQNIVIPQKDDLLVKRIYVEDSIEILKEGETDDYYKLISLLKDTRLIIFSNLQD